MDQGAQHVPRPTSTTGLSSTTSHPEHATGTKIKPRIAEREAASAKRRCVSTACIACRRRKSKVHSRSSPSSHLLILLPTSSAMETPQAAPLVLQSTAPNVSTIPTPIIEERASTRKTLTISRRTTPPSKRSSRPFSTIPSMKYPT